MGACEAAGAQYRCTQQKMDEMCLIGGVRDAVFPQANGFIQNILCWPAKTWVKYSSFIKQVYEALR